MFCSKCGLNLEENMKFCPKCGNQISNNETKNVIENPTTEQTKHTAKSSGITSRISFPISLIVRLLFQDEYYQYINILDSRYVYKLNEPWMTFLTMITLIFVSITLYKGSKNQYENKQAVYVILATFTALSLLAIFFPVSTNLFDF